METETRESQQYTMETEARESQQLLDNSDAKQNTINNRNVIYCFGTLIIACIVSVVVYFLVASGYSHKYDIDADWVYNLILSTKIDSSEMQHGVLHKDIMLRQPKNGLYRVDFDEFYVDNGPENFTTSHLTAQSRIVFNFALAYQETQDEKYLIGMNYGLEVLLSDFYDDIYGGYYVQITKFENDTYIITNDTKNSYHLAFVIKALSKVYQVTLNETHLFKAMEVYDLLWNNFTDFTSIGMHWEKNRNFSVVLSNFKTDNNMLHVFHASKFLFKSIELYEKVSNSSLTNYKIFLIGKINDIFYFVMDLRVFRNYSWIANGLLIERTYLILCENFDEDWICPVDNEPSIGHSLEFAVFMWNLIDMELIDKTEENIQNINDMFTYAIELSYNASTGSLYHRFGQTTHVQDWWTGLEAIRTLTYFYYENDEYSHMDKDELLYILNAVITNFKENYYDPIYGGVYANPFGNDFRKGFDWKIAFHVIESAFDILNMINYHKL
eukprot:234236_1